MSPHALTVTWLRESNKRMHCDKATTSAIYTGKVRHRRYAQREHAFCYPLYMLALDLDELEQKPLKAGLLGTRWYHPVRFVEKDYLSGDPAALRLRIINKAQELGARKKIERIVMLIQARCMGLYFSPVNFYFCYGEDGRCSYMLAEVSNTPWNQRHCYLVDMAQSEPTRKVFHVSPFMDLNMNYHWKIKPPCADSRAVVVHIENRSRSDEEQKLFDATMSLKRQPLTADSVWRVWLRQPMMTLSIVKGIYYQALRLFIKRIRFVPYNHGQNEQNS